VGNGVPPKLICDIVFEGVNDNRFGHSGVVLEDEEMEMLTSK
jgi:hypothetical protein